MASPPSTFATLPSNPTCCGWNNLGDHSIPDMAEDEAQIVRELNQLTVKERERVYEELHGVANPVEETPEMIEQCLQELRRELSSTPRRKRRTFGRALFLKPNIVQDDKFLLMFLRCDRYDAMKAAQRIYALYDFKLMLFGEDKLVKKITLEDLDEDAMTIMRRGAVRKMPKRDEAGRTVIFIDIASFLNLDWKSMARYSFYQSMTLAEDEYTQKHGVIDLMNFVGMRSIPSDLINFNLRTKQLMENLPLRRCGFHICFDDPRIESLIKFQRAVTGKDIRLRERTHFGSDLEIRYFLMTFGIVVDNFGNGATQHSIVAKTAQRYIEERRQNEREQQHQLDDGTNVAYPKPEDVLVGRGRPYQDHSGSKLLARRVGAWADLYKQASKRTGKAAITQEILDVIQEEGGRFLRRTDSGWKIVDDHIAKEKIGKALWYEIKQRENEEGKRQECQDSSSDPLDMPGEYQDRRTMSVPEAKRARVS